MPEEGRAITDSWREIVMHCVMKGMNTLGEGAAHATLYHIEKTQGLRMRDIPDDPDGFTFAMRAIFGVGSGTLLNSILAELRLKEEYVRVKAFVYFAAKVEEACKSVETGIM